MIKLIDGEKEYLKQYKEAYLMSLKEIENGTIKKYNLMFMNPDEIDIIQKMKDNRDRTKLKIGYVPSYDYFIVGDDNLGSIKIIEKMVVF